MTSEKEEAAERQPTRYSADVELVRLPDRDVFLVGTAHISAESVELVHTAIAAERPDCACVEPD